MNSCQKVFSAVALALLSQAAFAQAPALGAASGFSVLGGSAVTCTDGVIVGNVGVSPGTAFTNTRCTVTGGTTPATNVAAAQARNDFTIAYTDLGNRPCGTTITGNLGAQVPLVPGVYCVEAASATTDGTLTLSGGPNDVWIFKIGAALTGTKFNVAMADGGQACNVYWRVGAAVEMTDSNFKGTVLAGAAITTTRGTVAGRVLATEAVTITGTSVISCATLSGASACKAGERLVCKPKKHRHDHDGHDNDKDDDDDDRDHDRKDNEHNKGSLGSYK